MHHVRSGWWFNREPDGSVTVTHRGPSLGLDDLDPPVLAQATFDPDTWTGIVAAMDARGHH